eukprot:c1862_g1_i1 orf=112-309(+)
MEAKQQPPLQQKLSPCQVEALKKCLEDHDGDASKCTQHVDAFKAACSSPATKLSQNTSRTSMKFS